MAAKTLPLFPEETYSVDTSALIRLTNFYPREQKMFKVIWDDIEQLINEGKFFATKYVHEDIKRYQGKDERLRRWAQKHQKKLFVPVDAEVFAVAQDVIAKAPHWKERIEHGETRTESDPFVIALAIVRGSRIITEENKEKLTRIPQIAARFHVNPINLFDFFTERKFEIVKR